MIPLASIWRCFQGVIPSIIGTCDVRGMPNVTYASQIHLIDDRHVALSRQFFNKTSRNLDENPRACAEMHDPVTFQSYRLHLKFLRSEKSGALFDTMSARIEAIASHTGMSGVFRLIGADVFEVLHVEKVEGFLTGIAAEPDAGISIDGIRNEIRGLQYVSEQINRASDLDSLLDIVLEALESYFGFTHSMVLLHDDSIGRLVTIASRGYGTSGVGAEVEPGRGVIGVAANERRVVRLTGLDASLRYGRAVRRESGTVDPEIPLPGLSDAQSVLVIPLQLCDRLVGVLVVEDREPAGFGEWHESYLEVIGNQIALGIDRMSDEEIEVDAPAIAVKNEPAVQGRRRTLTYYVNDDCVFIDGDYLIRNVPGRILWKLMRAWRQEGRREFTNRELRLDPHLGLPPVKDNLESRLILLRRRLSEKCPDLRIVSTGRGRFVLEVDGAVEMLEK
ncbi:MAG TPA: GAF domain-containing protein [Thermoanaerobaculia bacterium]